MKEQIAKSLKTKNQIEHIKKKYTHGNLFLLNIFNLVAELGNVGLTPNFSC